MERRLRRRRLGHGWRWGPSDEELLKKWERLELSRDEDIGPAKDMTENVPKKRDHPKPAYKAAQEPSEDVNDSEDELPKKWERPSLFADEHVESIKDNTATAPKKRGRPKKITGDTEPPKNIISVLEETPKKRGRPKKVQNDTVSPGNTVNILEPKKRGRPKKVKDEAESGWSPIQQSRTRRGKEKIARDSRIYGDIDDDGDSDSSDSDSDSDDDLWDREDEDSDDEDDDSDNDDEDDSDDSDDSDDDEDDDEDEDEDEDDRRW
ncbi:hypothetical protein TWF281_002732 [Arthrobotrys megalospora]